VIGSASLWSVAGRMALLLVLTGCGGQPGEVADLVLTNGKVVTVDGGRPEAEAVAIIGDRILAVGSSSEIGRHVGSGTRVIDLAGRLVVPGFIEGHGHFNSLGRARMILDLNEVTGWEEIVGMVGEAAAAAQPGEWITGRGWHQEKWTAVPEPAVDGVPVHAELSRASPDNPVLLGHASGHASIANARALQLAGITSATADPQGGEIIRDAAGNPTGLLRETAQYLVQAVYARAQDERSAEDREAEFRREVELAGREALAKGVTSFHDAGASFATIDAFRRLADAGELPIRLYVMVRGGDAAELEANLARYRSVGYGGDFLTVRSIKHQVDGALGAHGAWLLEPYEDLHTSTGLNLETIAEIERTARLAARHDYQLATHAIGDRGNREVLDLYERVFRDHPERTDFRWRVEHAQHLHPDDVPRFASLGVIASMQGIHGTSDGPWVPRRLGEERTRTGAYVWRSLIDAGAVVNNGTDVPVEDIDPIASFYASVSRRLLDGTVFHPEQRMTREEALASYTINNAFAAFEEDLKGSIEPGKLADLVVLSRDIMTIPEEEIPTTRVEMTILGGQIRHQAQSQP
jgi:predicted amidohydrolase YtcJ